MKLTVAPGVNKAEVHVPEANMLSIILYVCVADNEGEPEGKFGSAGTKCSHHIYPTKIS